MKDAAASHRATIAQALLPTRSATRDVGLVFGGAALTAIAAQVQIPWHPVPFTLQTLAVMLCGLGMGRRLGAASQLTYLLLGASGLPVFAGGAFGLARVAGPTGGYLISFVVVAYVLGWLAERGWTKSLLKTAAALAIGISVNLTLGASWLAAFVGLPAGFAGGFAPFIGIEILKSVIAVPLLPAAWYWHRGQLEK